MTGLFRDGRVYHRVFYDNEAHYGSLIEGCIGGFLPNYWLVKFTPLVEAPELDRTCRADYALIEKQYRQWLVVEVELECHPLQRHVIPQIEVLAKGEYAEEHAAALCGEATFLDPERVSRLVLAGQPEVLVIVNDRGVLDRGWDGLETRCAARLAFVEVFREADGDSIVEWSGHLPAVPPRLVTTCRMINVGLRVRNAAALNMLDNSRLLATLDGKLVEFTVNLRCNMLHPRSSRGLLAGASYDLLCADDGSFELKKS
jgi:hypothetical protein